MNPIKYLNGLGLVASEPRKIKSGKQFDKFFPAPKYNDKYLSYAGDTHDTIEFMSDIIKNTLVDTKRIAPVLRGKDLRSTLSNIFSFVFNHMQYKPDDPANEELRRPKRAWADRVTGVDCDCYSIFIGSVLSNLKIPFALRMVKINGKAHYQHVYVVVPKDGRQSALENRNSYFAVDPVLDTFNEEHPFTGKYDLFMQPIKYLNGAPSASLNGLQGAAIDQSLYYSPEAAEETRSNVLFFDGLDYYERVNGLNGLNGFEGLDGLGFLRKLWKGVKTAGRVIKNIGKKAVKKVVYKRDGTKRGVFRLFSKREQAPTMAPIASRGLTPIPSASLNTASRTLAPIGTSAMAANSVSPKDMVDIAKSMDKSLPVDQILNLVKTVAPDNKLINEIIDAKAKVNKGLSTMDARLISRDAAKAQEAEITKNVMDQVYRMKELEQPKQAGFGMNMNPTTMVMIVAAIAGTYAIARMSSNTAKAAA